MAFPWPSLQAIDLASSHLVEDMKLGIDLAIAGYHPVLDLNSYVWGILPDDPAAAKSQRTRWEQGHLQVLKSYVPRLWGQALRQLRPGLLLLGFDIALPPLALWSLLGLLLTVVTGIAALIGIGVLPLQIQLIADGVLLSSILIGWVGWGHELLSLAQLVAIPLYILWKIPIYLKALLKPETNWVRTKRNT
jgi:cellulose synthase/poly-beta-1,6-N-acetylglucosamine synthase-like glycosyltransferase